MTKRFTNSKTTNESYYIRFLNKRLNFKEDLKTFSGKNAYENAIDWGQTNLDNFHTDLIKIVL